VLRSDHPAFEVRVVDQSENDATEVAVKQVADDSRVKYVRSATVGLSAALNRGIENASGEIIAITGDDCEVHADWLSELTSPFVTDPRIGIVFGSVLPGPHDSSRGFVPAYEQRNAMLACSVREAHLVGGTSASMGLRKSVWDALGGFDEMLGVGSPLRAAEEVDLTMRALLGGFGVYQTPRAAVVHQGFLPWDELRTLIQRNWYGTGAAFAKSLKHDGVRALPGLARLGRRWLSGWVSPVTASLGCPRRWAILAAFVSGFAAGFMTPIDRSSGHYRRVEVAR
jgi:glycosyltransferase involved in cell wall biosynthesis